MSDARPGDVEITALEAELRAAQLGADVATLDRLLSDDLLFTGPDGSPATKADDLGAHSSGALRFTAHEPDDMRIRTVSDNVVVVALRARLAGSFGGQPFAGTFRYTRVWHRQGTQWRIVAGHVSAVPPVDAQS